MNRGEKEMKKKVTLYKIIGENGQVVFPTRFKGKKITITFEEELDDYELKQIELNKLIREVREMRKKRKESRAKK